MGDDVCFRSSALSRLPAFGSAILKNECIGKLEEGRMKPLTLMVCIVVLSISGHAALHTETVEYRADKVVLNGYLAYNDSVDGQRPGVLVVHEWTGLGEHPKNSARKLAELGYIALAVDMYGGGKVTEDTKEAAALSSHIKKNPDLARARFTAAMDFLKNHRVCDPDRIAAIGYCFGGTVVLEMARSGVDLDGVVSFHGGLKSALPENKRTIKAKILVCHGADDPHVPAEEVAAFQEEMRQAGADWQFNAYGGAVHSFTNPAADSESARYNADAARRSWEAMKIFCREIFGE
jgi:dienelactone hydrolase